MSTHPHHSYAPSLGRVRVRPVDARPGGSQRQGPRPNAWRAARRVTPWLTLALMILTSVMALVDLFLLARVVPH